MDAWKRYRFADGHDKVPKFKFRTSDDSQQLSHEDECDDEAEEQPSKAPISEDKKQLEEETQATFDFIMGAQRTLRRLYRNAPQEAETRLVLPHSEFLA